MKNKFIVITTCYQIEEWLEINMATLKNQSYGLFEAVFVVDDFDISPNTFNKAKELSKDDKRIHVIKTKESRSGQGTATLEAIDYIKPNDEDIIVEVDGDDWFSSVFVLDYLNRVYQKRGVWMTYGNYQEYPEGNLGGHYQMSISNDVDARNLHRKFPFPYSHLKTYKTFLFNRIDRRDLIDPQTGKTFRSAWDHALCIPMVEMAGTERIQKTEDILYVLNRDDSLQNESKDRLKAQKDTEARIRSGRVYEKINIPNITANVVMPSNFAGMHNFSLANKMFQIATVLSLAKKYNCRAVFPDLKNQKLHSNYKDNIFKRLIIGGDKSFIENRYEEKDFSYNEIPYKDNLELTGYYQSEKYFKENRNLIWEYFCPDENTINQVKEKYGNWITEATSCHIRRKDYLAISDHHPVLSETDYYEKALGQFPKDTKFLVFSDDMDWCKENLKGFDFTFISEPDYMDLWIMSLCKNNIIANSSFSWWGAWLNKNENKKVIAPKLWFGPKKVGVSDKDIIPKEWIRL